MKTRTKIITSIIALVLSAVMLFVAVAVNNNTGKTVVEDMPTRTVALAQSSIDAQSILDEFDDATLTTEGTTTYFEGFKPLDINTVGELDYISEVDYETLSECTVRYNFSYDYESNIVTIAAAATLPDGSIEIDEIAGVGFINDENEIDAVMNIDGEGVLLSEMRDAGMIENCGWFSNLIKNVVKIAVAAVVVAATAAVVVATAGAAAPALVAVGVGVTSATTISAGAALVTGALFYATIGRAAIEAGTAIGEDLGNGAGQIIDKVTGAVISFVWNNIEYVMKKLTDTMRYEMRYGGYRIAAINREESCVYVSTTMVGFSIAVDLLAAGNSVYNYTSKGAYVAVKSAGGGLTPMHHDPHHIDKKTGEYKKGVFYEHWHVHGHANNAHAFFGAPIIHL